jgi:UDP-N-acetylglucosamine--N-acetylmuramyl-(pentapeptide) pyrophosphoryl-undecaprenol N-acetylglucosamine transferase
MAPVPLTMTVSSDIAGTYAPPAVLHPITAEICGISIADITAWELPSILIPLPTAAANHQFGNAKAMADAGASTLLEQANLTAGSLTDAVRSLTGNPARMAGMASAAKSRARPDAAHQIAIQALRLVSIS